MEFEDEDYKKQQELRYLIKSRKIEWVICDSCNKGFKYYNIEISYMGSKTDFPFRIIGTPCPYCDNYVEIIEER